MHIKIYSLPLLFFLLLGCAKGTHAQYPFVQTEANYLHYDTNSATMRHFVEKWQQVTSSGKGHVSIMHIGSSHVQAGTLPHRVRKNLLTHYPNLVSDRGMVFPYSAAAKCNNPADYKIHCPEAVSLTRNVYKEPEHDLGLCGIAITAHDSMTHIQMVMDVPSQSYPIRFESTKITVLGESEDFVVPLLSIDGDTLPPSKIRLGTRRFEFSLPHPVDSFEILIPCDSAQSFTLTGVYLANGHPGISYSSIGVNGASLNDYLRCPDFEQDLQLVKPDLVIFGIGINDAFGSDFDTVAFQNQYIALAQRIRSVNPDCAFIFITNNDCYHKKGRRSYSVNQNGPLAREAFYRIAQATDGAVWDQFEIMGGLKSMEKWQKAKLAQSDRVHFTHAGYQLLGDLLSEAILKTTSKNPNP